MITRSMRYARVEYQKQDGTFDKSVFPVKAIRDESAAKANALALFLADVIDSGEIVTPVKIEFYTDVRTMDDATFDLYSKAVSDSVTPVTFER